MSYRGPALICVFVVNCVIWRVIRLLVVPVDALPDLSTVADLTIAELRQSSPEHGITHVEYQRFDPEVVFAARPGPDGMPGVAGTDDNMNGITDDRAELGATRSDDVCVILTALETDQLSANEVVVLQQGAFVATEVPTLNSQRPTANDRLWSF